MLSPQGSEYKVWGKAQESDVLTSSPGVLM